MRERRTVAMRLPYCGNVYVWARQSDFADDPVAHGVRMGAWATDAWLAAKRSLQLPDGATWHVLLMVLSGLLKSVVHGMADGRSLQSGDALVIPCMSRLSREELEEVRKLIRFFNDLGVFLFSAHGCGPRTIASGGVEFRSELQLLNPEVLEFARWKEEQPPPLVLLQGGLLPPADVAAAMIEEIQHAHGLLRDSKTTAVKAVAGNERRSALQRLTGLVLPRSPPVPSIANPGGPGVVTLRLDTQSLSQWGPLVARGLGLNGSGGNNGSSGGGSSSSVAGAVVAAGRGQAKRPAEQEMEPPSTSKPFNPDSDHRVSFAMIGDFMALGLGSDGEALASARASRGRALSDTLSQLSHVLHVLSGARLASNFDFNISSVGLGMHQLSASSAVAPFAREFKAAVAAAGVGRASPVFLYLDRLARHLKVLSDLESDELAPYVLYQTAAVAAVILRLLDEGGASGVELLMGHAAANRAVAAKRDPHAHDAALRRTCEHAVETQGLAPVPVNLKFCHPEIRNACLAYVSAVASSVALRGNRKLKVLLRDEAQPSVAQALRAAHRVGAAAATAAAAAASQEQPLPRSTGERAGVLLLHRRLLRSQQRWMQERLEAMERQQQELEEQRAGGGGGGGTLGLTPAQLAVPEIAAAAKALEAAMVEAAASRAGLPVADNNAESWTLAEVDVVLALAVLYKAIDRDESHNPHKRFVADTFDDWVCNRRGCSRQPMALFPERNRRAYSAMLRKISRTNNFFSSRKGAVSALG